MGRVIITLNMEPCWKDRQFSLFIICVLHHHKYYAIYNTNIEDLHIMSGKTTSIWYGCWRRQVVPPCREKIHLELPSPASGFTFPCSLYILHFVGIVRCEMKHRKAQHCFPLLANQRSFEDCPATSARVHFCIHFTFDKTGIVSNVKWTAKCTNTISKFTHA